MPREWDAAAYDRLPIPMTAWGETVLGWLDLTGDERVLDAGCGTGKVTALLRDRLPRGDGRRAGRVERDGRTGAGAPGQRSRRVRRGRSLATAADRPAGRRDPVHRHAPLDPRPRRPVQEPRGRGLDPTVSSRPNVAAPGTSARSRPRWRTWARASRAGSTTPPPRTPRTRLEAAGFTDIECWLHDEPTPLPEGDLEPYLEAICLGDHVESMAEDERRRFVHEVARRMPAPVIDYVRLNIRARRAGG